MDHAVQMRLAQRRCDLAQNVDGAPGGYRSRVRDQLGEREAVEVFHHVVGLSFARAPEVVHLHRVRVEELTRELHLPFETMDELVGRDLLLQDLDRGRTLEERVPGEIDRRHSALADLTLERVGTQPLETTELALQP